MTNMAKIKVRRVTAWINEAVCWIINAWINEAVLD
jgi:hypothetical protein